ncbi:MAG: D-aminoacylase [Acidobacteria bacterium]|nr:D-aminoacylase [Acidobacteriota bacterium]
MKKILLIIFIVLIECGIFAQVPIKDSLLIKGGKVIDGTGAPARSLDVRISGDVITEVGRLKPRQGEKVIEAHGMVVAPGFVDIHNHSERGFANDPTARSQILQGITTIAVGPDGGSPWPVGDYLNWCEKQKFSTNVIAFVGHATVRQKVMGKDFQRTATQSEISQMAELVEQGMREGAVGLSSGLEYDIGNPSTTEEIIELAKAAAKYKGIYMSHVRDEADLVMDAFREAIRIGRDAAIPVQISHIKLGTVGVWDKAGDAVKLIDAARKKGIDIEADCYPYDAWSSTITVLIPSRRHDDPAAVKRGLDDVGGGANVLITSCRAHPDYEGKNLDQIGALIGGNAVDAYIKIVRDGGAGVVCKSMKDSDIRTFYLQPWVMVSSDGGIGMRHPRGAGTFPRVLGLFVRERKWLSLEQAIRKMSLMPARRLGLNDRGAIKKGMKADIVIFDPAKIIDRSTMTQPMLEPVGVAHVLINGQSVVRDGIVTGDRSGAVLRHQ